MYHLQDRALLVFKKRGDNRVMREVSKSTLFKPEQLKI